MGNPSTYQKTLSHTGMCNPRSHQIMIAVSKISYIGYRQQNRWVKLRTHQMISSTLDRRVKSGTTNQQSCMCIGSSIRNFGPKSPPEQEMWNHSWDHLYRHQIRFLAKGGWTVGFPLVHWTRFSFSLLAKNFVSFHDESNGKWGNPA
jgi:hypothetical protein